MVSKRKLFDRIMSGSRNLRFDDFIALLVSFGFRLKRTRGSHHIFAHPDVPRPFPIQPGSNGQAKPYQIEQFIKLIERYGLKLDEEEP